MTPVYRKSGDPCMRIGAGSPYGGASPAGSKPPNAHDRSMTVFDPNVWPPFLRRLAAPGLVGLPAMGVLRADPSLAAQFIDGFSDERGHRRSVDRPFLAAVLGADPGPRPATGLAPDEATWWSLHGEENASVSWFERSEGPLLPRGEELAIEVWTERELSVQHAVWRLAERNGDRELRERCCAAARWAVAELQPDNATNHPWAVHIYLALAAAGDAGARMYAETQLHNCQVTLGRPDRFSAMILIDAADALERHLAAH